MWKQLKSLGIAQKKSINLPPELSNADEINNYYVNSIPQTNGNFVLVQ